ncbi:MAG TPA: tetratricopeptide repeat protein [Candidatus Binatia bacterium]|nr:tetratricopeptide repeat protein [Candidatus Binatia bacterium]
MSASSRLLLPPGIPATDKDAELNLLNDLEATFGGEERAQALWHLVLFYQNDAKRSDLAIALLHQMIRESHDHERKATAYLALGQIAQLNEKWDLALAHYAKALSFSPTDQDISYLLQNNAGYCLNASGLYEVSEKACRRTIEIDAKRHNAYKNPGISLYGQGDHRSTAWCWAEAIKTNPADPDAAVLLRQLLSKHPSLASKYPWIQHALKKFRKKNSQPI